MAKLYALFVGINEYKFVSDLSGAVGDIQSVSKLFAERVPADALIARMLLNSEATRSAMIDGFRSHLAQAREGDTALFYYCGHGSTERVPEAWKPLEPSGFNQTLIPYDARGDGVFDLADKELSALIHEVASGGAQVVVIADSCHSGGVTRDVSADGASDGGTARQTSAANGVRTLDDYLPSARELYAPERVMRDGMPQPRHIAIAACQGFETAKEYTFDGVRRGLFSLSLEEAMHTLGPTATYEGLIASVRQKVRDRIAAMGRATTSRVITSQLPNLTSVGGASGNQLFLSGKLGRASLDVNQDESGAWWLSIGMTGGIPAPGQGTDTEIAIFDRSALDGEAPVPIATAIVAAAETDRSRLTVISGAASLADRQSYNAAVTKMGAPSLDVIVESAPGAEPYAQTVRDALAERDPLYAVVDRAGTSPSVRIQVNEREVQLCAANGDPLPELCWSLNEDGLGRLADSTRHIAAWHRLRDLSPKGSLLNGAIRIELVPVAYEDDSTPPEDRAPHPETDGTVTVVYENGDAPRVVFRLRNTSSERLYVALFGLSDRYGSLKYFADFIPAGGVGYVNGGKGVWITIADWRGEQVRSLRDNLKAVCATTDFSVEPWSLSPLLGSPPSVGNTRGDLATEPPPRKPPVRTADGPNAFWGTTLLTVVTNR